jgi:predicted nucleic acid-binding protein
VSDYIVDASVAVKWFVSEADSLLADELSAGGHRLFAPDLIFTEVANALARKATAGFLSAAEACDCLHSLPYHFDDVIATSELIDSALENACALRHPVYDLIYLEAARRLNAQLVTADRRLAGKLAGTQFARYVMLLSDWEPV